MIEILRKEDIQQYKELIDSCFGNSNDLVIYDRYMENEDYKIFVKKIEGKIVGSITAYKINLFTFEFQPALELFNVCVLKEYRKQNIGKEILEYIKEYAKNNKFNSIYLNCFEDAHGAHKLYESVGMKKAPAVKFMMNL